MFGSCTVGSLPSQAAQATAFFAGVRRLSRLGIRRTASRTDNLVGSDRDSARVTQEHLLDPQVARFAAVACDTNPTPLLIPVLDRGRRCCQLILGVARPIYASNRRHS